MWLHGLGEFCTKINRIDLPQWTPGPQDLQNVLLDLQNAVMDLQNSARTDSMILAIGPPLVDVSYEKMDVALLTQRDDAGLFGEKFQESEHPS